jgi:hypothetical protein
VSEGAPPTPALLAVPSPKLADLPNATAPSSGDAPSVIRRVDLQFLPPWAPEWRLELESEDDAHLAALEEGVLVYVRAAEPPFDQRPHIAAEGRLASVPELGIVQSRKYEPQWLEFYGRWPDALWRLTLSDGDDDSTTIRRWARRAWRPVGSLGGGCEINVVGHSSAGQLLVVTRRCAGQDGAPVLYALGAAEPVALAPILADPPQLALVTEDALYLLRFVERPEPHDSLRRHQVIQRFACAPPYECLPEEVALGSLPGTTGWLDDTWARQSVGLAHPHGISIALQLTSGFVEAYLLSHELGEWRASPAPARISALLAVPSARVIVTRAPAGDTMLTAGDWPESKPIQRGDTLWLQSLGSTEWRPVRLPPRAIGARDIQVALDREKLWLSVRMSSPGPTSPRTIVFSTSLTDLPRASRVE